MSRIPDETIREIRERTDLVELIRAQVELRRVGRNFVGLCPFHNEKTPSFNVNPDRRSYKCFGCGEWGNAIDFVCKTQGKSFLEAVYELGEKAGVALPARASMRNSGSSTHIAQQAKRDEAFALMRHAAELFRETLNKDECASKARDYQKQRQIAPELAERFCLGYAPAPTEGGWDTLTRSLSATGHSLPLAAELGLVVQSDRSGRYFDRFRGRWMFPIFLPGRSPVGFSGRILPDHAQAGDDGRPPAKYVNSPESFLYKKGDLLFGLHAATRGIHSRNRIILVEGNVDVLAMHRLGYEETLAPLGTALTASQCRRLRRLTQTVVLCFDGDRAGQVAAWKALPLLLEAGIDPRIAALPKGQDPDTCDPEILSQLLERPPSALQWCLRRIVQEGGLQSVEAQNRSLRAVTPLLSLVPNKDERSDYAHLTATTLKLPIERVWRELRDAPPQPEPPPKRRPRTPATPLHPLQCEVLALLVDRPSIARKAERAGILEAIDDPRLRPLAQAVLRAALEGEEQPSEGALLDLVDVRWHRDLHDQVFAGSYRELSDPETVLQEGLLRCQADRLNREIADLDARSADARDRGDLNTLRTLQQQKIELRRQQAMLRQNPPTL